jgi:hypothetical protein
MDGNEEFKQSVERSFGVEEYVPKKSARVAVDPDDFKRPAEPSTSTRTWAIAGGVTVGLAAVVGSVLYFRSRSGEVAAEDDEGPETPGEKQTPTKEPPKAKGGWWDRVPGLPEASEVPGFDLAANWGKTPKELRPLFALMERASGIEGAARIFAVIAKREAGFQTTAHNDDEEEVKASRRAYKDARDRNPPLTYGEAAAEFGSGGLFGALAPYFLWTAVRELKDAAPYLDAPPEAMFLPRIAAFAAVGYMVGILSYYKIEDHADIKAGWASPSLLKGLRGGTTYKEVRTRFFADAAELGIDLQDTSTIPASLSAKAWPGAPAAFEAITRLPLEETRKAG